MSEAKQAELELSELQRHTLVECRLRANTILSLVKRCLEAGDPNVMHGQVADLRQAALDITSFCSALDASKRSTP